jgi:hypothetical protein
VYILQTPYLPVSSRLRAYMGFGTFQGLVCLLSIFQEPPHQCPNFLIDIFCEYIINTRQGSEKIIDDIYIGKGFNFGFSQIIQLCEHRHWIGNQVLRNLATPISHLLTAFFTQLVPNFPSFLHPYPPPPETSLS